ncbi:MAG TPA: hypothetical protein DIU15_09310 [Deltaproteobacteria bacterium]|nr:hypothetical protein [Deltaproteobacteria bacterium]
MVPVHGSQDGFQINVFRRRDEIKGSPNLGDAKPIRVVDAPSGSGDLALLEVILLRLSCIDGTVHNLQHPEPAEQHHEHQDDQTSKHAES